MINAMTAWKKVHSHSGQLSFSTPGPVLFDPWTCLFDPWTCLLDPWACLLGP